MSTNKRKDIKITHCAIFLTEKCNLACTYCYQMDLPCKRDMAQKTGENAIDFLISQSGKFLSIAFFGGEPLLRFDMMKSLVRNTRMKAREKFGENGTITDKTAVEEHAISEKKVEGASEKIGPPGDSGIRFKITFSINTNGLLLDREKVDFLRQNRMGIVLSIDGIPKAHNMRRKSPSGQNCFDLLEEKIPMLLENPRQVHIRMTVTPETVSYMFEGVKFIQELGFRSLAVAMDRANEGWDRRNKEKYEEQYREIVNWYMDRLREKKPFYMVDLDYGAVSLSYPYREKGMPCNAGMEGIAIDPEGVIYPCYRFVGMSETSIGDIYKGINEKKRDLYRRYSRCEIVKCSDCPFNFRCHRCPWLSYKKTGDLYTPVEINCFEAELMQGLFKSFRDTMEKEKNPEYLKRVKAMERMYF